MKADSSRPERAEDGGGERPAGGRRLSPLPLAVRMVLWVVGWVLLLVGIAGLALPGIQGCLTIFLAAAVLSLTSELVYRLMKRFLERWPAAWEKVERFRVWLHRKLGGRRKRE